MKKKSLRELVEEFEQSTVAETEALMERADAKTANKHTKRVIAAFEKLCAHGDAGRDALTALFNHPRPDVRASAAAFLLRYKTEEAKAILQEIAQGRGLIPFEAQETLKRWEEGTWELDPG